MGFPVNYTLPCVPKGQRKTLEHLDSRHTLVGNSWSVPVVAWLLGQLTWSLGLTPPMPPQHIMDLLEPSRQVFLQSRLWRQPLVPLRGRSAGDPVSLVQKLGNLVSVKGEDLLLTTPSSQLTKFHRLRASVPGKLWKWKIIAGWKWRGNPEHINSLELRAVLTSLKWRIQHQKQLNCRFLHLVDSLVVLHSLSRGRSSSRKLRSSMSKINALLLCSSSQVLFGDIYTPTKTQPTVRVGGEVGSAPSLGMPKRILEGTTQSERAKQRQELGSLKDLTVQPATKRRYNKAIDDFLAFLRLNNLQLPSQRHLLDPLVCEYLEHLWSHGHGRAQASDAVAGLQDFDPKIRGHLPGAWRLLKTWSVNEVPNRAPPLPVHVLHAMVGDFRCLACPGVLFHIAYW